MEQGSVGLAVEGLADGLVVRPGALKEGSPGRPAVDSVGGFYQSDFPGGEEFTSCF